MIPLPPRRSICNGLPRFNIINDFAHKMNRPDYHGGSIVNLMHSIIHARGGHSDVPTLNAVPVDTLAHAKNLILLVIDGLGAPWLAHHAPHGMLHRAQCATLTSVFPSTTASAIRTPGTLIEYDSLANCWFQPLTHLSSGYEKTVMFLQKWSAKVIIKLTSTNLFSNSSIFYLKLTKRKNKFPQTQFWSSI